MKLLPALSLLLAALLTAGCADPDDRKFFGVGWIHPETGANRRLNDTQTILEIKNDYDKSPKQAARAETEAPKPKDSSTN